MLSSLRSITLGIGVGMTAAAGTGLALQPVSPEPAPAHQPRTERVTDFKQIISDWPMAQRKAVDELVSMYGNPHEATRSRLTWFDTAPFAYTTIYRESVKHNFPKPHEDYVEQGVAFDVPPETASDLLTYDGSILIDRTKGRLGARCDKVPMNFLAINLAHDIISGERTVEEARDEYARIVEAFMKGDKDEYTQRLRFSVPAQAGFPDEPHKH